jgi:chromosome segregation ATPase
VRKPPTSQPAWNRDAELEATADELRSLRDQSQQMQQRQSELSASLEQLTQDRDGDRQRLSAIEAHLALQSTILEELKNASSQQQQETWRALDAVSEALDRILKEDRSIPSEPIAGSQSASSIVQEASQPSSSRKEILR